MDKRYWEEPEQSGVLSGQEMKVGLVIEGTEGRWTPSAEVKRRVAMVRSRRQVMVVRRGQGRDMEICHREPHRDSPELLRQR